MERLDYFILTLRADCFVFIIDEHPPEYDAGYYDVHEIILCPPPELDGKGDVRKRFLTAVVEHHVSLDCHT